MLAPSQQAASLCWCCTPTLFHGCRLNLSEQQFTKQFRQLRGLCSLQPCLPAADPQADCGSQQQRTPAGPVHSLQRPQHTTVAPAGGPAWPAQVTSAHMPPAWRAQHASAQQQQRPARSPLQLSTGMDSSCHPAASHPLRCTSSVLPYRHSSSCTPKAPEHHLWGIHGHAALLQLPSSQLHFSTSSWPCQDAPASTAATAHAPSSTAGSVPDSESERKSDLWDPDEGEVLLDEFEEDAGAARALGRVIVDSEWTNKGAVSTSSHLEYEEDSADEYDVEFDEAFEWEDEEELVDSLPAGDEGKQGSV